MLRIPRRITSEERLLKDTWLRVASSGIAIGCAIFLFASFIGYNFDANIADENLDVKAFTKYFFIFVHNYTFTKWLVFWLSLFFYTNNYLQIKYIDVG